MSFDSLDGGVMFTAEEVVSISGAFEGVKSSAGLVTDAAANFFLKSTSLLLRILDVRFWCSFDALWKLFKLSMFLCPLNCVTNVGGTSLSSTLEVPVLQTE